MGESSEAYLQKLIEEENVIKSALKLVKSRFLQLQVEHMGLKIAQRNLLLKRNDANSTVQPVRDEPCQEELNKQYVMNNQQPTTHDMELQFNQHVQNITDNCVSSEIISEKELDDPSLMNQMELDLSKCLANSSENGLLEEQSHHFALETESDDEG